MQKRLRQPIFPLDADSESGQNDEYRNPDKNDANVEDASHVATLMYVAHFWARLIQDPSPIGTRWLPRQSAVVQGGKAEIYVLFGRQMRASNLNNECRVSEGQFWAISRTLLGKFRFSNSGNVELPPRRKCGIVLRSLGPVLSQAAQPLTLTLRNVAAKDGELFPSLDILLTGDMVWAQDVDNVVVCYLDNSSAGAETMRKCRLSAAGDDIHPVFMYQWWKEMLFLTASLAKRENISIRFSIEARHFYHYVSIHDETIDMGLQREYSNQNKGHDGAHIVRIRTHLEADETELGACDVYLYQFTHSERYEHVPNYRGTQVSLVFRQDFTQFFFHATEGTQPVAKRAKQ